MNRKTIAAILLLMVVFLVEVPGSFAHPQYLAPPCACMAVVHAEHAM